MSEHIVFAATALRAQKHYQAAVDNVRTNMKLLDDATRLPGLLQVFYAAHEGDLTDEARQLAKIIAKEDPKAPYIQPYLR